MGKHYDRVDEAGNPMQVTLNIPDNLAEQLRAAVGSDIGRAAIEHLALEGYRTRKLSRYEVQQLLGFDNRWDVENWLGAHGIDSNYSIDDLEADRNAINQIFPK